MEQTECSETSAYKIQTTGNYPKESIQHSEQGESLKSRILISLFVRYPFRIQAAALTILNAISGAFPRVPREYERPLAYVPGYFTK